MSDDQLPVGTLISRTSRPLTAYELGRLTVLMMRRTVTERARQRWNRKRRR